ncbi:MAG: T9SS type A sorting domain-containing protein [Flavobacteriales bacterium]|nr:T9SS type A sorting domain-containing protein [Flavobacteriales bacterium]MDW8410619.1 glycosyl hydrolase family 28-related protein [Flavobacteriales bacterium]
MSGKSRLALGLPFMVFSSLFLRSQNLPIPDDRRVPWGSLIQPDTTWASFPTLNVLDFGIDNTGAQDVAPAVNNLIQSSAPAILFFPEGDYLLRSPIFLKSGIILRGEGNRRTRLHCDLTVPSSCIISQGAWIISDTSSLRLAPQFQDSFLVVQQSGLWNTGHWIKLTFEDSSLVHDDWAQHTVGQIFRIKKVENDTLFTESPVRLTIPLSLRPFITKILPIEKTGINCLKIIRHDNTLPEQASNILFQKTVNAHITGVESEKCNFSHISLEECSDVVIAGNYFHEGFQYGGGGRAYGVVLQHTTQECLVENNIFQKLRHGILFQTGSNANVIAFNFFTEPFWDEPGLPSDAAGEIVFHGNYPFLNLVEQNILNNLYFDNSHGGNGPYNTIYRNQLNKYGLFFSSTNSPSQNLMGNHITNTQLPYSLVNYTILGGDHFIFGNNNKGTVDPAGTEQVPLISLGYEDHQHIPKEYWLKIGYPNTDPAVSNMAKDLFHFSDAVTLPCGGAVAVEPSYPGGPPSGLLFYPNPVKDVAFLFIAKDPSKIFLKEIFLYDIFGKILNTWKVTATSLRINFSEIPPGIYFLKVGMHTLRIVKI